MSEQLGRSVKAFQRERLRAGDQARKIDLKQEVSGSVEGDVSLLKDTHIQQVAPDPDTFFQTYLRFPLDNLYARGYDRPIVLLIAGLEQAIIRHGQISIASLIAEAAGLPPKVRLILTSDHVASIHDMLEHRRKTELDLSSGKGLEHSREDIRRFVLAQILDPGIKNKLAKGLSPEDCAEFAVQVSRGSFLYAALLVEMAAEFKGEISRSMLRGWPRGLNRFYRQLLDAIVNRDDTRWENEFQSPLGTLAVVRTPLLAKQIAEILERRPDRTGRVLRDLRRIVSGDKAPASKRAYRLFHSTLASFLTDEDRADKYWCEASYYHAAIARSYLNHERWWKDPYARHYLIFHLIRAGMWDELGVALSNLDYLRERRENGEQYALQSEVVEILQFPEIREADLEALFSTVHEALVTGLEASDEKADWLDTFAFWLVERGGSGDDDRSSKLRELSRRFDASCASVAGELRDAYWSRRDVDWALRFAELASWVTQRAGLAEQCVAACREAEAICSSSGIEEIYATLGLIEFMRVRARAARVLAAETASDQEQPADEAAAIYETINELLSKRDQRAWQPGPEQWRLLEDDEPRRVLRPRSARRRGRFRARVVSNTHDCVAAIWLISSLEELGGRVEWVHSRRFRSVDFSDPEVQVTVLIGGPKAPGLAPVARYFREADYDSFLRAYSATEFVPMILAAMKGDTRGFMVGGPSKLNTLVAADLLTRDPRLLEAIQG